MGELAPVSEAEYVGYVVLWNGSGFFNKQKEMNYTFFDESLYVHHIIDNRSCSHIMNIKKIPVAYTSIGYTWKEQCYKNGKGRIYI